MSVELTGIVIDTLPVTPNKARGSDDQSSKETTDAKLGTENKFVVITADEESTLINKEKALEEKESMTVPQLEKVAKQLQEFIGTMNRGLEFSVDEDSGRDVIKVIDKKSGELIKQYPSEEVLSLVSKLSEATGTFIDSKV